MSEQQGTGEAKAGGKGCGCASYLVLLIVVIALLTGFLYTCTKKVRPWEVGLRYWNVPVPGMVKKGDVAALEPGYSIVVPYLHQFNRYDIRLQRMEMAPTYPGSPPPDMPPLKVRTSKDARGASRPKAFWHVLSSTRSIT